MIYKFKIFSKRKEYEVLMDREDMWIFKEYNIGLNNKSLKYKNVQYVRCWKRGKSNDGCIMLHRLLTNAKEYQIVDHRNRNTLDNRRCNLRIITTNGNAQNRSTGKYFNGKKKHSQYKGVTRRRLRNGKLSNRWRASIKVNNKPIRLGEYGCEIDAANAYDKAALKYHGEYASPNFIEKKRKVKLRKR